MEKAAIKILENHGCKFIRMLTECRVLWENQVGIVRSDDVAVLKLMTKEAWNYWAFN